MPIKGTDVAIASVGGLFVYAGIRGYSPLKAAQNIIQGQSAKAGQSTSLIGGAGGSVANIPGNVGGLVSVAMGTVGHPYQWDGSPGPSGAGPWDCSSAFNWWSTKAGFPIPGFPHGWDYQGHGPNTVSWLAFSGMTTVGHQSSMAQPGDACVWQTHMGLCVGPNQMISALNPHEGTKVTPIGIIGGEVLFVRRFTLAQFGGGNLPGKGGSGSGDFGGGTF